MWNLGKWRAAVPLTGDTGTHGHSSHHVSSSHALPPCHPQNWAQLPRAPLHVDIILPLSMLVLWTSDISSRISPERRCDLPVSRSLTSSNPPGNLRESCYHPFHQWGKRLRDEGTQSRSHSRELGARTGAQVYVLTHIGYSSKASKDLRGLSR